MKSDYWKVSMAASSFSRRVSIATMSPLLPCEPLRESAPGCLSELRPEPLETEGPFACYLVDEILMFPSAILLPFTTTLLLGSKLLDMLGTFTLSSPDSFLSRSEPDNDWIWSYCPFPELPGGDGVPSYPSSSMCREIP